MLNSERNFENFLLNFVIVGVTSSAAKTLTAPIDRIKLILQNQNSAVHILTGERQKYKGLLDCLVRIPKEQGLVSLWRGNGTNLLRYIPGQALNFSFHDFFKHNLSKLFGHDCPVLITFLAGGCAGACSIFTIYPLKFCQTRLSVDMGTVLTRDSTKQSGIKREFDGLVDCCKKINKKEGIQGLYRGFIFALVGSTVYRAMYFGVFDALKRMYAHFEREKDCIGCTEKLPLLVEFIFAQSVTTIAGLFTYPFDTVGRRLMLESGQPNEMKLLGSNLRAFKFMYINEGPISFYRGALANCIRSACGALVLVLYEEFLYYSQWKGRL